jgi:cytochrome c oxidase assembly protein subunit 15
MGFVHMHLTMAAVVVTLSILLVGLTIRGQTPSQVRLPAQLLSVIVLVQIALGITTWIVNYALPWQELTETLAKYAILAKGYWESLIVTAHMATGSLIIAIGTVLALRAWRSRIATDAKEVNRKWKQQVT